MRLLRLTGRMWVCSTLFMHCFITAYTILKHNLRALHVVHTNDVFIQRLWIPLRILSINDFSNWTLNFERNYRVAQSCSVGNVSLPNFLFQQSTGVILNFNIFQLNWKLLSLSIITYQTKPQYLYWSLDSNQPLG